MERRTFLALGAAAVGLAGCTRDTPEPGPPSAPPRATAPVDPDSGLRDEVAASEVGLIASYRSAIGARPELAADLEPFLAHHEQHLARIAPGFEVGSPSPLSSGSRSESSSASPQETSGPSAVDALAGLAAAESEARAQRAAACDGAQDPGLARDLCLIAASEAQHEVALEAIALRESGS